MEMSLMYTLELSNNENMVPEKSLQTWNIVISNPQYIVLYLPSISQALAFQSEATDGQLNFVKYYDTSYFSLCTNKHNKLNHK